MVLSARQDAQSLLEVVRGFFAHDHLDFLAILVLLGCLCLWNSFELQMEFLFISTLDGAWRFFFNY